MSAGDFAFVERADGSTKQQRSKVVLGGWLPTTGDFARAIVDAAADQELESGETIYVGSTTA